MHDLYYALAVSAAFGLVVRSVFAGKREKHSVIRQQQVNRSRSDGARVRTCVLFQRR